MAAQQHKHERQQKERSEDERHCPIPQQHDFDCLMILVKGQRSQAKEKHYLWVTSLSFP